MLNQLLHANTGGGECNVSIKSNDNPMKMKLQYLIIDIYRVSTNDHIFCAKFAKFSRKYFGCEPLRIFWA